MRRFYGQFIQPGDVCFDVGAHVGNRVSAWRELGASVVAVEPQRRMASFLRWYFRRDSAVTVLEKALAANAGQATFLASNATPTLSTLTASWAEDVQRDPRFRKTRWDERYTVEVETLDSLVARYGRPTFCKIDVEGGELDVLQGLSEPLDAFSFEYIPVMREQAKACVRRLESLGAYRYNWSKVETMRFGSERWLDADGIVAYLDGLADDDRSGDVYAVRLGHRLLADGRRPQAA
jgi:FkbM family methyltransferase